MPSKSSPETANRWALREAAKRKKTLTAAFDRWRESWPSADLADCFLNSDLLKMACEAYFKDIARLKEFHGIEVADSHKRASYSVKWFMRFRPIQINNGVVSERVVLANERFALTMACQHLGIAITHLPAGVIEHVLYYLRYRQFDADSWGITFYLLQRCYQGGFLDKLDHL